MDCRRRQETRRTADYADDADGSHLGPLLCSHANLNLFLILNLNLNLFLELIPGKCDLTSDARFGPSKHLSLLVGKLGPKYPSLRTALRRPARRELREQLHTEFLGELHATLLRTLLETKLAALLGSLLDSKLGSLQATKYLALHRQGLRGGQSPD